MSCFRRLLRCIWGLLAFGILRFLGWYLVANGSGQHIGVIFKGAATHVCLSFEDWPDMFSGTSVPHDQNEQRNNSEQGRPQIWLIYEANARLLSVLCETYASLQVSRAAWLRTVVSFDVTMHCSVCGLQTSFERTLWSSCPVQPTRPE